jgi:hypothetical protein
MSQATILRDSLERYATNRGIPTDKIEWDILDSEISPEENKRVMHEHIDLIARNYPGVSNEQRALAYGSIRENIEGIKREEKAATSEKQAQPSIFTVRKYVAKKTPYEEMIEATYNKKANEQKANNKITNVGAVIPYTNAKYSIVSSGSRAVATIKQKPLVRIQQESILSKLRNRFSTAVSNKYKSTAARAVKSNTKIKKDIRKFSDNRIKSRPIVKKDTGGISLAPNQYVTPTNPDRNPFPFKSTAQMIAEQEYQRAASYNALKDEEYLANYRKERSQFFRS